MSASNGDAEFTKFFDEQRDTIMHAFPEIASLTQIGKLQYAILQLTFSAGRGSGIDAAQKAFREAAADA